jgi:hypothetical protein
MDLTMMERVGDRWEKMEGYCSTGQSPQQAAVPVEEEGEEDDKPNILGNVIYLYVTCCNINSSALSHEMYLYVRNDYHNKEARKCQYNAALVRLRKSFWKPTAILTVYTILPENSTFMLT